MAQTYSTIHCCDSPTVSTTYSWKLRHTKFKQGDPLAYDVLIDLAPQVPPTHAAVPDGAATPADGSSSSSSTLMAQEQWGDAVWTGYPDGWTAQDYIDAYGGYYAEDGSWVQLKEAAQ